MKHVGKPKNEGQTVSALLYATRGFAHHMYTATNDMEMRCKELEAAILRNNATIEKQTQEIV